MELLLTRLTRPNAIARIAEICLRKLRSAWISQKKAHTLVVSETASLGERRFVAVVKCGRQRFLVGASSGSVTMLARLEEESSAGDTE
jgi:flagellar biogenesis protein FliO